jgi:serine/threonine-protein kinase
MELLRGRTLYTRLLDGGPLPARAVISMALRVLDVLAYAHDRGVVHRDVKPSNIFETDEGAIKLLDFGIARVQEGEGAFLTRPGTTLGTPAFMAPELAAGRLEQLDALTDLWALGATMFQLLTADVVHPSRNDNEALVLAATAPARSLASLRPDLDPEIINVIDRALAFERSDRWPNARAMSQALTSAARAAGFATDHQPPLVADQFPTAPEMALSSARAPASVSGLGIRLAAALALVLAVVGTLLAIRYRARDVQAKTDETVVPPAPARLTAAASQVAPAAAASVPREPEKAPPVAKSYAAPAAPNRRSAPQSPSAAPAGHSTNPLFFPGQ